MKTQTDSPDVTGKPPTENRRETGNSALDSVLQAWAFKLERIKDVRPKNSRSPAAEEKADFEVWAWLRVEESITIAARECSRIWHKDPLVVLQRQLSASLLARHRDGVPIAEAFTWPMARMVLNQFVAVLEEQMREKPFKVSE